MLDMVERGSNAPDPLPSSCLRWTALSTPVHVMLWKYCRIQRCSETELDTQAASINISGNYYIWGEELETSI